METSLKRTFIAILLLLSSCGGGTSSSPFRYPGEIAITEEEGVEKLFVADLYQKRIYKVNPQKAKVEKKYELEGVPLKITTQGEFIVVYEKDGNSSNFLVLNLYPKILSSYPWDTTRGFVEKIMSLQSGKILVIADRGNVKDTYIFYLNDGSFEKINYDLIDGISGEKGEIILLNSQGYAGVLTPPSYDLIKQFSVGLTGVYPSCRCGEYICIISGDTVKVIDYNEGSVKGEITLGETLKDCGDYPGSHTLLNKTVKASFALSNSGNLYFLNMENLCELKLSESATLDVEDSGEKNNYSLTVNSIDECSVQTQTWDIVYDRDHPSFVGITATVFNNVLTGSDFNFVDKGLLTGDEVNLYDGRFYTIEGVGENYLTLMETPSMQGEITFTVILKGFSVYGSVSGVQKQRLKNGETFTVDDKSLNFTLTYSGEPDEGDKIPFIVYERNPNLPLTLGSIPFDIKGSYLNDYIYISEPALSSVEIFSLGEEIKNSVVKK